MTEDEVPAGVWDPLSAADADASGGVSLEELTTALASNRPDPHGHGHGDEHEPGQGPRLGHHGNPQEFFARLDANSDGSLTEDEVTARLWEKISGADANADGLISLDELVAFKPTPPPVAHLFAEFDADEDGSLTETEVSARVWGHISSADTDGDGLITVAELTAALPSLDPPHGGSVGRGPGSHSGPRGLGHRRIG